MNIRLNDALFAIFLWGFLKIFESSLASQGDGSYPRSHTMRTLGPTRFFNTFAICQHFYIIYFKNVKFPKLFCPRRSSSPPNPLQKGLSSVNHGNERNKVLCKQYYKGQFWTKVLRPPPPIRGRCTFQFGTYFFKTTHTSIQ